MPELPDLQVFSKNLDKALAGKKVKKVSVVDAKTLKVPAQELAKSLEKQKLLKVERVGKELHFYFENGNVLALHLMRNGKLCLFKETNELKFTIIELIFDDNTRLALTDFQGFAKLTLNPVESPAPDAVSKEVNFYFLKDKLQTKTIIKTVLVNQNIIRGIGNAYADEILWDSKISPFSISKKIPDDKIKALLKSIKVVLADGEKQILKSHPDIIAGEIRDFLSVHNSKKKQSPTGAVILKKEGNSGTTYYTDEQELYS